MIDLLLLIIGLALLVFGIKILQWSRALQSSSPIGESHGMIRCPRGGNPMGARTPLHFVDGVYVYGEARLDRPNDRRTHAL
jgi:hypothetical protein